MANPFDQFDAPQQTPATNPFDQFDNPSPSASTSSDVGRSFGEGVVNGMNTLIGMPADLLHAADQGMMWAAAKGAEKLGYLPQNLSGLVSGQSPSDALIQKYNGSAARAFLDNVGVPDSVSSVVRPLTPTSSELASAENSAFGAPYQPKTTAGQYAQTVGSFLPGAVAMPAEGLAGVAGNAIKYGVIPGVASEAAGQATQGTDLEPYARAVAGIGAGVGSDLALAGGKAAVGAFNNWREPMVKGGDEAIAARTLRNTDPNLQTSLESLDANPSFPGATIGENIPGSKPTLGQATGSLPILSVERQWAVKNDDQFKSNPYGSGSVQQTAARTNAINNIQPSGSPEEIGNTVRQQMAAIDAAHDAAIANATADAQNAGFDASNAAQSHVADVAAKSNAAVNDATTQAQTAGQTALDAAQGHVEGLGAQSDADIAQATQVARDAASGIGTGAAPEDVGARLRGTLQTARDAAKGQERALWNAVDPDGTLALPASPVIDAANSVANSIPSTAKPMSGEEAAIFDTASNLPSVAPFNDITALRSRISTAMRQELIQNGQSPTYARLSQLRGSVEDAIENAVAHKAAADQAAVSAGGMSPSDAVGARIANAGTSEVQGSDVSGVSAGKVSVNAAPSGTPSGPSSSGAQGQGNLGLRNDASGQGIPGPVARSNGQVLAAFPQEIPQQAGSPILVAQAQSTERNLRRGWSQIDDEDRELLHSRLSHLLVKNGHLKPTDIPVELSNRIDTASWSAIRAQLASDPQAVLDSLLPKSNAKIEPLAPKESQVLGPGKVYYPSGSLDVNYEVANLPDLITSHDTDFRVNPDYPAELQPRARESAPARDQVNSMAARLEPERLGPSVEANSGVPIVGPDNVVESGNGRTLAIKKAYQTGNGDYRNWLASQGIDTSGIDQPILVGRRQTPLTPEDRIAFAHSANTASGLRMNAAEQAAADARLITPEGLSAISDGSAINSEANRTFVRSFLSQLPAAERGAMMDAQGNLSQAGIRRLEAAMASRAYGDGAFVTKAFDTADQNIRGLAGGLTDASGSWMKMRQLAREGVIDPGHDITPDLMNAARAVMRARDAGRPVSEILNQSDMFGGETSALAKRMILNDKGGLASREQIAERLQKYANEAQKNVAGPSLFGDTVSPAQVLKTSLGDAAKPPVAEPTPISAAMQDAPSKPPKLVANIDESAAGRLKAASAATKARAQTFDNGAVGQVLKKAPTADQYQMANSAVPGKVWVAGPGGAERVQAFAKAAGASGPPDMRAVHEAASESVRREAMTPDGVIDPKAFAKWQDKYQDALRALPADLKAKFSNASEAAQTIAELEAHRKLTVDPLQNVVAKLKSDRIIGENGIVDQGKFANWKAKNADAIASLPADVKAKLSTAENASKAVSEAEATRSIALDPLQKAVEDLHRSQVVNADGIVSPKGLANWKAKNPEVLKALPDAVKAKLDNASTATEAIGEAATAKKAAMDEYQKGLLKNFVNADHPQDITKAVSNIFGTKTAVRDMSTLARKVHYSDAREGLRKVVADIIARKATGATEAGASDLSNHNPATMWNFLRDNAATIKAAGYSDKELNSMQAIAHDLRRSQRTMSATKLPNSPGTAQDLAKLLDRATHAHFSLMTEMMAGAAAGKEALGLPGAAGGAGLTYLKHLVSGARNAGMDSAGKIVEHAIQDPNFALALLKKIPQKPGRGSEATLAKILARNSMFAGMTADRENQRQQQ